MAVISQAPGPRFLLVAIVGPTGSGKSALAIAIARRFGGEVVSCDALQVYRGLDIGTGKLTPAERAGVPHHLLDVIEPDKVFSAADYLRLAAPTIRKIDERGRLPIVAGGTGLYLRALLKGLAEAPGRDPELRARLRRLASRRGLEFLHRMLARVDRSSADRLHPNDRLRVERALEITLRSRRPMSELMAHRQSPLPDYRPILIGLGPPKSELARRIEARVGAMFERGLVDEVRRLVAAHGAEAPAFKAIGYREVIRHLAGEMDLEEARRLTVRASLQYAKRQRVWFHREPGISWFAGGGDEPEIAAAAITRLETALQLLSLGEERLHAETAP